jgi:hypothetical protein
LPGVGVTDLGTHSGTFDCSTFKRNRRKTK